MASIFDLQNAFDPSQEAGTGYNLYQKLLQQRAQIEQQRPDVAAQLPSIAGNTPGERMYQNAQQQPAQDLGNTVGQALGPVTQALAGGPQAKPKDQEAAQAGVSEILSPLNPLNPKKVYGPNVGEALGMPPNSGGILGLGIQPIDVLSFAIFAGLTSRMPQEQALKTTMWGASLPRQFRENQEKQALEFVKAKQAEFNSQIAGENLLQRQQENAFKQKQRQDQLDYINNLTNRLSTGVPLTELEQQINAIGAKRAGIDPNVIKDLLTRRDIGSQLANLQAVKQVAEAQGLGQVSSTLEAPGGQKFTIGEQRRGAQDVSQRTREILAAAKESGQPLTIAQAHDAALKEEAQLAGNKAGAVAANTPLPAPVQGNITRLQDLQGQLQTIKENFDPAFVGPVVWRTYAARRQGLIPGVEAPSAKEVAFHQAQEYLQDIRLRVQSGAQTSEPEAARLLNTLPQGTDDPGVYATGFKKAREDIGRTLGNVKSLAVTPKKELRQGQEAVPAPQVRKELPPPPAGWKY